ncbi:hypothetical protein [Oleiharenicola lentus]|uniref:hypothetical protein n=1 Tax=Oleiharenicola lentus TaxID=2508720 RepID=UPI003F66CF36
MGIKDPHVAKFLRKVTLRVGSMSRLCALNDIGRSHVSNMLNEDTSANRGRHTWKRLKGIVTRAEWTELEQCSAWNAFARNEPGRAAVIQNLPCCDEQPAAFPTHATYALAS